MNKDPGRNFAFPSTTDRSFGWTRSQLPKPRKMPTTCSDCGLTWTNQHNCKAPGKMCLKCGNYGHFARVCRSDVDESKDDDLDKPLLDKPKKAKKRVRSDTKENSSPPSCNASKKEAKNNNPALKNNQFQKQPVVKNEKTAVTDDVTMKDEANSLYKQGNFKLALEKYTKIIELYPNNECHYTNRSACYMMLNNFKAAFLDAKKSLEINPKFVKAHIRFIKCALSLGNLVETETAITKLQELDPSNELITSERNKIKEIRKHLSNETEAASTKNYTKALCEISRILAFCKYCVSFKLRRGEYLALLRKYKEAENTANEILEEEQSNVDAKYILALCIYQSDVDKAVEYIRNILRLVPDHPKVVELYKKAKKLAEKKKEGNDAFQKKVYFRAYGLYLEAINVDPTNLGMKMKLYYNMSQASYKLGKIERSIEECTKALEIDSKYVKALMRRGRCYMDLKQFEEAVADLTRASQLDDGKDVRKLLDEAKVQLVAAKKDYHRIIGVKRGASKEEIQKAYKQKAMLHHPDRHAGAPVEEQKKHEKKFKEISQAYRMLMIETKKSSCTCCNCGGSDDEDDDDDDDEWEDEEDHDVEMHMFFAAMFHAFKQDRTFRKKFFHK